MFLLTVGGRAADRLLHKEVIEKIISSIRVEPGKKPNPKTDTIKAQQDAP